MSAITDYFTARTDEHATSALAVGRPEASLTGRSYDEVAKGTRCGKLVAMRDDGDTLVLTVADELRYALAELNAAGVAAAATTWAIGEMSEPAEESVPFLTAFAEPAARAVTQGGRMYGYVVI
ncbi:hypothetical protein QM716_22705 [Rhodococcus sp. IEGM 1409]|uniref:hypothetical protein n=1 Tax=Rhodococcus sp. IEGM 1409 TaxID=3047082 RepID=UPI0024B8686D|nr:hypothetical protein [Rhodococcus sp. IEGM 1409]MDI9902671.1 hypothetical protein [Rhodococcus sp. IEGM 1409]